MSKRLSMRGSMVGLMCALATCATLVCSAGASAATGSLKPAAYGELDCNGDSPIQVSVRRSFNCTDIRGFEGEWNANTWDSRFYDNGEYIGHDEPDMTFLSRQPGSGNDVTWQETIPSDPSADPTVRSPGHDVVDWFELSPAPWYSMAICDPNSYPQAPCKPNSDSNAPTCVGANTTNCSNGGGSAFMEMQLYPPGMPPWVDSVSCDDAHWCAALTIDSLECTTGFVTCNAGCEEPVNFAWIQRDGVPSGPASPQLQNLQSQTPNRQTLLMNPGDRIEVHMFDAPAPGGGRAFEVLIRDLTTGQSGWMQASAANGFANTSISDCSGTPFNFQPEYSTASQGNYIPWAALQTNISTEYETGHFEPCTRVTGASSNSIFDSGITDTYYNVCHGPYEDNSADESTEPSDAYCYPKGDTHGALDAQPDLVTGCEDDVQQNGDLDFDGTSYYPDWPVGPYPTSKVPGSFVEALPSTDDGSQYSHYFTQTDIALSESSCPPTSTVGCTVPPAGPGGFYPYWSRVSSSGGCTLEFGNVSHGPGVNDLGGDAQYGSDLLATLGYPEFEGPVMRNSCDSGPNGT